MLHMIDWFAATREERLNASLIAVGAVNAHGPRAARYLRLKLLDRDRQGYHRSIRLALHLLRKQRPRRRSERLSSFFRVLGPRRLPKA